LPAPNTAHEIDELKQIMRKSKIKIQPLNTINRGNYLMYPKSEVFSSNFARDPANSNVTRWAMVLEDDKMRLDIVNETSTEITYLSASLFYTDTHRHSQTPQTGLKRPDMSQN
jgi:hypothetical protein